MRDRVGQRLGDTYELKRLLGQGGMAEVYEAAHVRLPKRFAVKFLHAEALRNPEVFARFQREAEIASSIGHPHITDVFDFNHDDEGAPYIVLEYLDGEDLDERLKRRGRLEVDEAVQIVDEIASALGAAHEKGVVHRDVKPANVYLVRWEDRDDFVKVLDFGISKTLDSPTGATKTGTQIGTPRYMSPEQVDGASDIDARTDVFALGALAYELLAGRPAFDGPTLSAIFNQVCHRVPTPLLELRPEAPPRLAAVVERALAKARGDRYASMAAFREAWSAAAGRPVSTARPRHGGPGELAATRRHAANADTADLNDTPTIHPQAPPPEPPTDAKAEPPTLRDRIAPDPPAPAKPREEPAKPGVAPASPQHAPPPPGPARARAPLLGLLAVAALGAAAGLGFWDYTRLKIDDYATVTERWEVMAGLFPVGKKDLGRRASSYRFYSRRGRIEKVERRNGLGQLAEDEEGKAVWQYVYRDSGKLEEAVARDRRGQVRVRSAYSSDLGRVDLRDTYGNPLPYPGSDAAGALLDFDERGFLGQLRFVNVFGSPRPGARRVFGYAYARDPLGQVTRYDALGADGRPVPTVEGLAHATFRYDARGAVTDEDYFAADGKPTVYLEGVASVRHEYDDAGRLTKTRFLDEKGAQVVSRDGCAARQRAWDARGNLVETVCLGLDQKATLNGEGWAVRRVRHDERGNAQEVSYFGYDGKPTLHRDGFAVAREGWDPAGNQIEARYFGLDGRTPTLHRSGIAGWRAAYDARGNKVEVRFFGLDGGATLNADRYSIRRVKYDERGRRVEVAHFGIDERPTRVEGGCAVVRVKPDDRGRMLESACLGASGEPVLNSKGFSVEEAGFDDAGNRIRGAYFGLDRRPILSTDGDASWTAKYDGRGNRTEQAHFGVDGTPRRLPAGFASWRASYDPRGDTIERSHYGEDGRPIRMPDGYATIRHRYDERGNPIEESYFDEAGQPVARVGGYVAWRASYDRRGRMTERITVGADGKPVVSTDGYAIRRAVFDDRGNQIEERYFDAAEQPIRSRGGYAAVLARYDERSREIERSFVGTDGKPAACARGWQSRTAQYDPRGNKIEEAYFDVEGKPALDDTGGYSRIVSAYDALGNRVEITYYGVDGAPVSYQGLFPTTRFRYDASGHLLEGSSQDPAQGTFRFIYDRAAREVRRLHYDLAGAIDSGQGQGPDGKLFRWAARRGVPTLVDEQGRPARPALGDAARIDRAKAHLAGGRAAELRGKRPELFEGARGLLVVGVRAGSMAEKLRLGPGDILLECDGEHLDAPADLEACLATPRQRTIKLVLLREDADLTFEIAAAPLGALTEPE